MGEIAPVPEFTPPDRFRLLRRLGEGGMGVVYEALDQQRSARVAIKTIRRGSADHLLRFKREFRLLQDLHHQNLVSLGELFSDGGHWFFTMELVEGTDFVSHVRGAPDTPPDYRALRRCLAQLAEGLYFLHRAHKVHRDIKPSNVLVTSEERVVILDFGVVVDLDDRVATSTEIVGTATYMAPEQALGEAVGPPADLYAVGVLLYEALTGRPPLVGAAFDVLRRKVLEPLQAPSALAPGTPPDLDALTMALLASEPDERPSAHALARRLGGSARAPSLPPSQGPEASFIGREPELAQLAHAFERFRRDETTVVVVEGESGVGKTALVQHFLASHREPDIVVLAGRCRERESVPFNAFDGAIDALSRFLQRTPNADSVLPVRVDVLTQAFPVFLAVKNAATAPLRPDESLDAVQRRQRLFSAVRELFVRLGQRFTVVLVLDDLQWADVDSLALLAEITRAPDAPRVLVLATRRLGLAPETSARIDRVVGAEAQRIVLRSLTPSEAQLLAAHLGEGTTLSPADAERIAREAHGHPLFIDELIRYVARGGTASGEVRLDDALWARVGALDAVARDIVTLVAVAGAPIATTVLAHAAKVDGGVAAMHLEELRTAQLVRGTEGMPAERFEPYHDRVREAVMTNLAPDARRAVHERIARSLEAHGAGEDEALAMHWREAGDGAKAARFAARAAAGAMTALAFDRAADLYRLALELDAPSGDAGVALRTRLAEALASAGRGAESARAYLRAAEDASPDAGVSLRERAASQLMRSGHMDEGYVVLRSVLAAVGMSLPTTPLRALASFLFRRILVWLRGFEFRERAAGDVPPHQLVVVDVLWSLSFVLSFVDTVKGGDFQARYMVRALDAGEPHRIVRALANEAPYGVSVGMKGWRQAQKTIARARALADRLGDPRSSCYVTIAAGIACYLAGRFKESLRLCDEGLASPAPDMFAERMRARHFACHALAMMGEFGELALRAPEYLRDAEAHDDVYLATNLQIGHPHMTWLLQGDVARARAGIANAKARWNAEGFTLESYYLLYAEVQTDLYTDAPEPAWRRVVERWRALRRSFLLRIQTVRFVALHLRARAALTLAERDQAQRPALLADAARAAKELARDPTSWGVPLSKLVQAGIARLRGGAPLPLVAEAARGFAQFDMNLYAAAARRREAELRGGDAGRGAREEAERYMRAQGVADVERVTALLAPGFGETTK